MIKSILDISSIIHALFSFSMDKSCGERASYAGRPFPSVIPRSGATRDLKDSSHPLGMTPFSCLPLEGKVLSECEADEVMMPMPLIRQPFGLSPSPGGRRQEWGGGVVFFDMVQSPTASRSPLYTRGSFGRTVFAPRAVEGATREKYASGIFLAKAGSNL